MKKEFSLTLISSDGGRPCLSAHSPTALPREALLDVDLVLISHNHWDHFDRFYLKQLSPHIPVVTPKIIAGSMKLLGAGGCRGLAVGETDAVKAAQALNPQTIQPRAGFMRSGQTLEGFKRRMDSAGLKTEMVLLKESQS